MSRLSHRQLDRHIDDQEEELQWQREQDELNMLSEQISEAAAYDEACKENESFQRQKDWDAENDRLYYEAIQHELDYDPWDEDYDYAYD